MKWSHLFENVRFLVRAKLSNTEKKMNRVLKPEAFNAAILTRLLWHLSQLTKKESNKKETIATKKQCEEKHEPVWTTNLCTYRSPSRYSKPWATWRTILVSTAGERCSCWNKLKKRVISKLSFQYATFPSSSSFPPPLLTCRSLILCTSVDHTQSCRYDYWKPIKV